ncbi:type III secretion system (T3SS) inner membrane Yop/YscD-like protein [Thermosporothrix hazakensis]|uniref:Type III secretion system (T3SS) inner membrane Yop/YscD-like protein n=1 Tax=Thermosporothrix hazakensis TaxID=644383 RepID=A0A326U2B6_THEHA|nr:type III secretion system (T3SS) inner membrane Yop/YscD-like protein [Thermosporothrix hazakensis]
MQQSAPTVFAGGGNNAAGGWNQQPQQFGATPAPASEQQWGAPQQYQQQNAPWQPQQGGFNTPMGGDPTVFASENDADKTVLRSQNPVAGIGYVRVKKGKDEGRVYEIRKESLSIGRSRESDIFLEDLAVSRLHASLVNLGNGNYALKDEGSANGTKVNDQLVNKYQTYQLKEGDEIQLGQTVLVFSRR